MIIFAKDKQNSPIMKKWAFLLFLALFAALP